MLAGSLPRKVPTSFYEDTTRELARRDVRVVLDSEGEPLRVGVQAGPFLVSPNQREAEQLVGQELEDDDDFLMALDAIAEMGAQRAHHARERLLRAPSSRPAGPGAGAARRAGVGRRVGGRLAQFLAAVVDDRQPDESLRMAVAAGAASVREVGAGRFDAQVATAIAANVEARGPARRALVGPVRATPSGGRVIRSATAALTSLVARPR